VGRNRRAPSVTGGARKNPVRSIQRTRNLFGSPAQGGLNRNAHISRAIEVAHDDPPTFRRIAYLSFGKSDVINNTILAFAQWPPRGPPLPFPHAAARLRVQTRQRRP
jgi:hypothetical protein